MSDFEDFDEDEQLEIDLSEDFPSIQQQQDEFSQVEAEEEEEEEEEMLKIASNSSTPGVVYLSRIPPFMSPAQIRSMLSSSFGVVTRIFLRPEDKSVAKKRKKFKNNGRKNYVDGWVEFAKKRYAKEAALALNNQTMGGKKRSAYCEDLWNIKYLKGFKWTDLSDQIGKRIIDFFLADFFSPFFLLAYNKAVRDQKIRTEMSQAKKEYKMFVEQIKKKKAIDAIRKKRVSSIDC
jgi:ESF2/ABP1 family protein